MDSWKPLSDGRGVWLSDELGIPADGHGRCNNQEMGYKIKPFSNIEGCPLVSNTQALERLDFMDLGFSDEIRKSYSVSREPNGEVFSGEIATDSYGNVISPLCEEKDLGSRLSTDFMQSNSQDCSLIDLKLGRLADGGVAVTSEPESSAVSSFLGKRARSTKLYPRSTCCQVFGCNKDLSSVKGYYKRHKVCDVHTKTTKVIVDGIEQRFCQQCSRFHLLAEFDDGKRSCRRRLAAHNKRRRKPQLNSQPGMGMAGFSSSFSFQEVLPSIIVGSGQRMDHFPAGVKEDIVAIGNLGVQSLSDIHQNGRALSLLSAPSHSMSLGAAITSPLIHKGSHADSSPGHSAGHSGGLFRKVSQSGLHASGMYSMDGDHVELTMIDPRDDSVVDLKLQGDDICCPSNIRNASNNQPLGHGVILDLLQLSSHLQRIEQQRHSTESEAG